MRAQRQMWIASRARPERLALGRGWQVRIPLRPWRSKIPVKWTWPIVARRAAGEHEVSIARACTPSWPDDITEGWVLTDSRGDEHVFPSGVTLVTQRVRTPARVREQSEWRFH